MAACSDDPPPRTPRPRAPRRPSRATCATSTRRTASASRRACRTSASWSRPRTARLVAEATTDADGHYLIPIDEPGTYVVRLDQDTLPEGLTVAEGKDSFTVELTANNTQTRGFFLGQDLRITEGRWSQLPQVLANGLKLATIIAITSIGLSLIFGTTGLSNFAHGEMVTFGAVIAWGFNRSWASWTLIMAAIVGDGGLGRVRRGSSSSLCGGRCVGAAPASRR